ncbi:putative reverse transcriptase zinc-binding domain-containing protein [Helianthus anomalus]
MDRIPTRVALRKRNIQIEDSLCPLCRSEDENTDHLFISCFIASNVWNGISTWCKIPNIFVFSIRDLLECHTVIRGSERKKEAVQGIIIIICWSLWRARNNAVFSNSPVKIDSIMSEIKALCFLWFSNRSKFKGLEWKD